jgi:two-component system sensor histidine kinase RpfC
VNTAVEDRNTSVPAVSREIMLVEDNENVARALKRYLESKGYGAPVFFTGRSALAHIEHTKPAAAVVDLHLPDLSGLVLIQQLRAQLGETTPIVVLSGDVSMATINSLPHVGATYFFSKPVQPGALLERLEQLMGDEPAARGISPGRLPEPPP